MVFRRDAHSISKQLSLRIVWEISQGVTRFNALERKLDIGSTILSRMLTRLQRDGLIAREVIQLGPPPITSYALTELGASLAQSTAAFVGWLDAHRDDIHFARECARGDDEVASVRILMAPADAAS